jgi:hypothetical protein
MAGEYVDPWNTYPIYSRDESFEGAVKRYTHLPTPTDLINFALKGMPKVYPLTKEPITQEDVESYLTSAFTEIEMGMGMDLSPVERFHSVDYVTDMFEANWCGIRLPHFPATQVLKLSIKFSHAVTATPFLEYVVPANWVLLKLNKVNLAASTGTINVRQGGGTDAVSAIGLFSFVTGFARGNYQPNIIEVQYVSGFAPDKVPAVVADLIKTVAAIRMLSDLGPLLFPFSSTSVQIDGVSQSAGLPGPRLLEAKVQALREKRAELESAIKSHFGRSVNWSFIGA